MCEILFFCKRILVFGVWFFRNAPVLFNCSQQGHFAWWQSLSEVQGTVRRHPPSHRASWRVPPPHTTCREAFIRVSQVLRHDNPKLNRRTTTIVRFGTSFGEIFHWRNLPGEICWRNLSGEICRRNLLANLPVKFAGEICGRICRQNFRRKTFGKDKPDFRRKTTPKKFHLQTPPFSKRAIDTSQKPCLLSSRPARGSSSGQGTQCVQALQTPAPSKRHEEVPKLGFSVIFAVT